MAKYKTTSSENLEFVPEHNWPGPFGIYKFSKAVVTLNLPAFLILTILTYITDITVSYTNGYLLTSLLYIVSYLFMLSATVVLINSVRQRKISIADALDRGTRLSLRMAGLYILIFFGIVLSIICFIVPVFIVLPRLIMAPYYMFDQNLSIIESLKAAWRNGKGHAVEVWGVISVQVLFSVLILILIGIYFSIIYSAAMIILYHFTRSNPIQQKK